MRLTGFKALTFDCYGTLIDWEKGIVDALAPVCRAHGVRADDETLLHAFAAVEHDVQAQAYKPYRQVLAETLVAVGDRLGFEPTDAEKEAFGGSVGAWPPFPDAVRALKRLAERYGLAILSNVDDDLFAGSAEKLQVPFDHVITAQQVGSYKPAPGHFHEILTRTGIPRERILHVAQSLFHDIAPARSQGFTTLWINRRKGRPGSGATPPTNATPDAEVADLAAAADLLAPS
jgi:2-haloacid dehalogenase